MTRDYWQPDKLTKAAQLLADASRNLHTTYPNSVMRPDPATLKAVRSMIDDAIECISLAQPNEPRP